MIATAMVELKQQTMCGIKSPAKRKGHGFTRKCASLVKEQRARFVFCAGPSKWRRHGQTEPQQSHSRELVPPSHYRETSAMNSVRPSQSSRNREMDHLRAQMLPLQRGARHHKGNRDHWEIMPDGGDSCRGENTLRYPWLH
ncbi:hypothetical protein CFP56_024880 [Quercus suber]|uniref:Uncharacterized protein n=1 Tax=Quercus suber TaxID=58331 RepID=A0AAW0K855_QUESU